MNKGKRVLIIGTPGVGAAVGEALLKAHVSGYTTSKGTYVAEHEDKRQKGGDSRVSSDEAFDKISAAGGKNASTTSGAIHYYHDGQKKSLAHKEGPGGSRTVSSHELDRHLSAMKGSKFKGEENGPSDAALERFAKTDPKAKAKLDEKNGKAGFPVSKPEHTDFHRWKRGMHQDAKAHADHEAASAKVNHGTAVDHHDRANWHDAMSEHYGKAGNKEGAELHKKAAAAHRDAFDKFAGLAAKKHDDMHAGLDAAETADKASRQAVKHDLTHEKDD